MELNQHDDDAQYMSCDGYFDPGHVVQGFNGKPLVKDLYEANGPFGWRIKEDKFNKDLFDQWLQTAPASWGVNQHDILKVYNRNRHEYIF